MRSTSSPIPYPCYTILGALRSVEVSLEVDLIAHTLFLLHYSERLEVCGGSVEVSLEVDLIAHTLPLLHHSESLEVR